MSIPNEVHADILQRLDACEQEHDVRIIYCAESGSRAWGFASPDSDFDVRFIYVHKPSWYMSFDIERKRDLLSTRSLTK